MPERRAIRLTATAGVTMPLVLACGLSSCRSAPGAPPTVSSGISVILISVDTLRADRLNCYGYRTRKVSPNIDALAGDGILFENHITASPWTTPAHLSMLTSLYPFAHGVTQSLSELKRGLSRQATFNALPAARTTLAEVLGDHGYATAAFTGGGTVDPAIGFGRGFDRYDTSMFKLSPANLGPMYDWVGRQTGRPLFLFWHHFEVHGPYLQTDFLEEALPAERAGPLRQELQELARDLIRRAPALDRHASFHDRFCALLRQHRAFTREVCEALYLGSIRSADRWLGDFLQLLRRHDLYEPSLIIFTSDHGEEFADHSPSKIYNRHGHTLYQELLRVPLIVKLPYRQYAGTRVTSLVRMIDLMPTVLDLLEIEAAGDQMQGTSLRPLWERPGGQQDRTALSEALSIEREKKSLISGAYKYILSVGPEAVHEQGRGYLPARAAGAELYDLHRDPGEKLDLLARPHGKQLDLLAESLEQRLRQHLQARGPAAEQVQLEAETIEKLEALGYIRGDEQSNAGAERIDGRRP